MSATIPAATQQISYTDLYARWEQGNWRATEVDFSQDRIDWQERMTPEQRRGALWIFTLFFHGEDTVADTLGPYIEAAPLEEQKVFLTTQQVDEARHTIFFKRFFEEVVGVGDGTVGGTLQATLPQLSWGHRRLFDELERTAEQLRRKPRDKHMLARALTHYHIIVEAGAAQAGQHTLERALEQLDLLPGFREGMRNVSLDEQRHIAFGVRLLAELHAEDPEGIQEAVAGTFRDLLTYMTCLGAPPNLDPSYTAPLGYTLEELFEEGARAQDARLRAIGLPVDDMARFPIPMDLAPRERAQRGLTLIAHGYLGPKERPFAPDEDATAILFDQMRRTLDPDAVPAGTVIEWAFTDVEPWHIVVANGATRAQRGPAPTPSLRLRTSLEDFVDITADRVDARKQILRRKLRPSGDPRVLVRLPKLFG